MPKLLERMINMSHENNNTKTYRQLTKYNRGEIQALLDEGYSVSYIAAKLKKHRSTIYREIKRGSVNQIKIINGYERQCHIYYAETAQLLHDKRVQEKFSKPLTEKYSAQFFQHLSKELKQKYRTHSVDTYVHWYKEAFQGERIPCTKTVYSFIRMQLIDLKPIDLPRMVRLRKRQLKNKHKTTLRHMGTSIDERPLSVASREEFGHYEIDLVHGKKGKNEGALLTLVERKTRFMIVRKLPRATSECVNQALKSIFREYGKRNFKSITADNGSEFSRLNELESPYLKIYYAHPYSSFERGTNENHNGQLREFIPKGISLKKYNAQAIKRSVQCLNRRPRRNTAYETPEQLFYRCLSGGRQCNNR